MNQDVVNQNTVNQDTVSQDEDTLINFKALLNESAQDLNPKIVKQLADVRQKALANLANRESISVGYGVFARLYHEYIESNRIATAALACSALFAALVLTQQFSWNGASDSGDALLLASDLPPEAFTDNGFEVWLASSSQ